MWKKIHYGYYEINRRGVIRRIKGGNGTWKGRRLKPYSPSNSEPLVSLFRNGIRRQVKVSTLMRRAWR